MSEKQFQRRRGTELTYEVTDDEALSEGVVAAVADASDADPAALDPLAQSIDPDALDALFDDRYDGTARDAGVVRFTVWGYDVVVCADGCVSVLDPDR